MSLEDRKKLVAKPIAELLKPMGFRKSGSNFVAKREAATLTINLQSSVGSSQDVLKITCNAAIHLNQISQASRPNIWNAHWQERIGFFMPEPRDYWWLCPSDEAAEQTGREIAALLEESVIPEIERLAVPAAMAAMWKSGRSPGLTAHQCTRYLNELAATSV